MELDELKAAWQQHHKALAENTRINIELYKAVKINQAKSELRKPIVYEMVSVAVLFAFALYVFGSSLRIHDQLRFSVPGFAASVIALIYLIFSILKIRRSQKIEYYGTPVVQLQEAITHLHMRILRLRKFELILLVPFIVTALPILFIAVHGIDLYVHAGWFIFEIVVAIGVGVPLTIWLNRHLYDKKIEAAKRMLSDLQHFKSEENR